MMKMMLAMILMYVRMTITMARAIMMLMGKSMIMVMAKTIAMAKMMMMTRYLFASGHNGTFSDEVFPQSGR